ncbi:MAG: EutN/CcmL family microcompartment protein [Pseudomonadota bacterium]
MILCKILGSVVSTIKHEDFKGHKILIAQPIDKNGEAKGKSFLTIDSFQAGKGDIVLVAREGNTACQILGSKNAPFHSVVVGIVDDICFSAV